MDEIKLHDPVEIEIKEPLEGEIPFTGDVLTVDRKKQALQALIKAKGMIYIAYHKFDGIRPQTIKNWIERDPAFSQCYDHIQEFTLDMAESRLHEWMLTDKTLLMFKLNNHGRERGYIPPAIANQAIIKNEIIVVPPHPKPDKD